jgi:ADP-ribosylglycohydrolase
MESAKLYNKIYGALIGVAYGDSMGMPAEFWTRQRLISYFGKIESFLPAPIENEITKGLRSGEVTDDTYMTQIIAEALIEEDGLIIPEKLVQKILTWADANKSKINNLFGPSTKKAFDLIMQGSPIAEAGKNGTTNGGAMRIVPVGIISNWRNLDELVENVRLACLATHNTNLAIAASSAIAACVSYGIDGDGNIDTMIEIAKSACAKGMAVGYESIGASVLKRIEIAIDLVKKEKNDDRMLQEIYDIIGTGLPASESIPAALALVYRAKGNPISCALLSANIGGDTDTIGAMSCGICGAFSGIEAFPDEAIKLLSKTNDIDFASLAQKLLSCRQNKNF